MRTFEPAEARGSLKWLREAVNEYPQKLNQQLLTAFGFHPSVDIEWVSPLRNDDYAEYRDADFLSRVGVELGQCPLESFWPTRGPQWDGLARTSKGSILLLEANANSPEVISPGTAASAKSRSLIEQSLNETKKYLRKLYQYTNRLAHLYLLRVLNNVDAYLC